MIPYFSNLHRFIKLHQMCRICQLGSFLCNSRSRKEAKTVDYLQQHLQQNCAVGKIPQELYLNSAACDSICITALRLEKYLDSHSIQKKNYVLFQRILPSTPHSRLLTKNFSACVVCLSAMTNAWCSVQRVRAGITSSVWDLNQRRKSLKAGSVIAALVNKSFNLLSGCTIVASCICSSVILLCILREFIAKMAEFN